MKLIALNLPRDLDEQSLSSLFKEIGALKSCTLVLDKDTGKSKGFGFVEMALEHDGETAIIKLHGSKVGKNKIRVKPSA
ncbi:MAG: RNA recognition motif containing protein [Rhodospirillaceae bacterium]|nr:RNA recognition motif containing protein [Rhodospirillaceae bacterium]